MVILLEAFGEPSQCPACPSLPSLIQKHRQKGVTNPSDGVSVCLEAEELSYFRDCEEGDVQ